MKKSNYDIAKENMQVEFLKYDQEKILEKFHLQHDDDFLYIRFVQSLYRIGRKTGLVEHSPDGFATVFPADYNEAMTIYDMLCYSKDGCRLSGKFQAINGLKGTGFASKPNYSLFAPYTRYFDHRLSLLADACERLGGSPQPVGDVSYRLSLFDFFPVILQFWESDEEFDASLRLLWDENTLDFIHYETSWFATMHLLEKLKTIMEASEIARGDRL